MITFQASLARLAGRYDELNLFGTRTGRTAEVHRGEQLPVRPRSYTWGHVPALEC
jgi:hypothetical protein